MGRIPGGPPRGRRGALAILAATRAAASPVLAGDVRGRDRAAGDPAAGRGRPGLILLALTGAGHTRAGTQLSVLTEAPLIAGCFLVTYALLVALLVRLVGARIRPAGTPTKDCRLGAVAQ